MSRFRLIFLGRYVAAFIVLFAISACASRPPPITADQASQFRLSSLEISAKEASIWWGEGERAFAKSQDFEVVPPKPRRGDDQDVDEERAASRKAYEALIESPEARAYLEGRIEKAVEQNLANKLELYQGDFAVDVVVSVQSFRVTSSAQSLIFGGSDMVIAKVELKDPSTGDLIAMNDNIQYLEGSSGLVGVIVDAASRDADARLGEGVATEINDWIFQARGARS